MHGLPVQSIGGAEWHSHAAKSFISYPLQAGASEVAMVQEPVPLHQVVELLFAVVSARLVRLLDEVLVAGRGEHGGETGGAGVLVMRCVTVGSLLHDALLHEVSSRSH